MSTKGEITDRCPQCDDYTRCGHEWHSQSKGIPMTPPRDALIAWVKEQEADCRREIEDIRRNGDAFWTEECAKDREAKAQARADHFAALHALLENRPCIWREEQDGEFWRTDCGQDFVWENGPPSRHCVTFCGHCGHPITEVPYVYTDDDDEPAPSEAP